MGHEGSVKGGTCCGLGGVALCVVPEQGQAGQDKMRMEGRCWSKS